MQEPRQILEKYWGHSSFRSLQEDIILKAANNEDVLALLPTGGGKSLCFQIPALLNPGICIVVSPLIALMEDQVNALKEKGIKALAITGGIPFSELDTLLDNCIYGNYKFLYLSPERLQQDIVQERIRQMNVNLIAIDEAHCISQWGHDFRPAYRNIMVLREIKPEVNVIALTASATKVVVKDIVEQLQLRNAAVIKKSFERKNIGYSVRAVEDKNYYLEKLITEHEEAVIIYVRTRKATVEIATYLERKGHSAAAFNGGLAKKEKSTRLNQWLKGEKRIMVATSAFGMGIDKANVRTVIHMNLPESLESYFQEAGRAGRDEQPAKAVILTNESDIPLLKNQFLSTLPDVAFVKLVYKKLISYFRIAFGEGEGSRHDFNFSHFCHTYDLNPLKAYNTLQLLDRASVLQLSEQFQKKTRIQFLISHHQLSYFLESHPHFEAVVKAVLRTYGGIFENKVEINLQIICSKAGTIPSEVIKILQHLHKEKIADFEHEQHDASVTFLVPREDESTINPLAPYIKLQESTKKEKIAAVLDYVHNTQKCRSEQLLNYFGEKDTSPCGICSVCRATSEPLTREKIKKIYYAIVGLLEEKPYSSREIAEKLPFDEQHIVSVLQLLVEKDALTTTPSNTYKLKHL
jgi:ATP-dependent DNA helicase RecQ